MLIYYDLKNVIAPSLIYYVVIHGARLPRVIDRIIVEFLGAKLKQLLLFDLFVSSIFFFIIKWRLWPENHYINTFIVMWCLLPFANSLHAVTYNYISIYNIMGSLSNRDSIKTHNKLKAHWPLPWFATVLIDYIISIAVVNERLAVWYIFCRMPTYNNIVHMSIGGSVVRY